MERSACQLLFRFILIPFLAAGGAAAQSRGLEAIRAADMRAHLEFLSASEFEGRSAPSTALNIASRYLALQAKRIGLKPLLPDGSYLQYVPVDLSMLSPAKSRLRIISSGGEQALYFPQSFSANARSAKEGTVSGSLVFLGTLLQAPPAEPSPASAPTADTLTADWDQLPLPDLKGKIVVLLEVPPPVNLAAMARSRFLQEKGALGCITVISAEREKNLDQKGLWFDASMRLRFPEVETAIPGAAPVLSPPSIPQLEIRHEAGSALLGVTRTELDALFAAAAKGQTVASMEVEGRTIEIRLYFETRRTTTSNVVGWVEGSDRNLKSEYVVLGAHHDHNPMREGRNYPGADDNGSGTVAMLSLAQALQAEKPRRSVIFVWNTAEEKGLIGAFYFVQHCPVPVEKISANLNLDMISRNDPDMIYLIGSNRISSELDKSIHEMNNRSVKMRIDYTYESPTHPDRFFYRSDQYPYIRYGIPGVWFFCGTTPDYHQETDSLVRADLEKAEKVAKLVYLTCLDIGNKPELLKLDLNPAITTRGPHNMKINWQRP
jgi:hypothetical protein